MPKTALLIDGGHLRASAKNAGHNYDNSFIEKFAAACIDSDEYLFRVLYYDAPLYRGYATLPISGQKQQFKSNDRWLLELSKLERFAVRRGTLGFRGYVPKRVPVASTPLTDADFRPVFEQKGVDMRVGLDIATLSDRRVVDRILLVSGDQDMIPAMKHARKAGVEVALIQLPKPTIDLHDNLLAHSDFVRSVNWQ